MVSHYTSLNAGGMVQYSNETTAAAAPVNQYFSFLTNGMQDQSSAEPATVAGDTTTEPNVEFDTTTDVTIRETSDGSTMSSIVWSNPSSDAPVLQSNTEPSALPEGTTTEGNVEFDTTTDVIISETSDIPHSVPQDGGTMSSIVWNNPISSRWEDWWSCDDPSCLDKVHAKFRYFR